MNMEYIRFKYHLLTGARANTAIDCCSLGSADNSNIILSADKVHILVSLISPYSLRRRSQKPYRNLDASTGGTEGLRVALIIVINEGLFN